MFIPEDLIENIRESNDIVDIISEYVSLQKKGKNHTGLCPFHKEKTPSFSVQQDKQIYHCFGCGEGGNVFSFLMKYKNMGFIEAVKMLAERANITIPDENGGVDKENQGLRDKLFAINRDAAIYFYTMLQKGSAGLGYLRKRGIVPDIIKRFGLGYSMDSWDGLMKYLTSKGYTVELAEKAGLIIKKNSSGYYDRFRNRVMFPVRDIRGRVIGFGGRVLDDSKPKYLNSPETLIFNKGYNLYGLNLAVSGKTPKNLIMVEGYMDVIALHQYGIDNAVASLGTALTREQAKLLKRYSDEIIISYDSDTAGQTATMRGLDILSGVGCNVRILNVPKGKDPDEYIRVEGREAFLSCMENAIPLVEYKIRKKGENFDTSTTEGKIGFTKACAMVFNEIDDPVVTDAYISKISNDIGISPSALYEELGRLKKADHKEEYKPEKHISGKSRYNNNVDGQKLYLEPAYIKAEKIILHLLFEKNNLFDYIKLKLSYEDFNDDIYSKVASIAYDKLSHNKEIIPASIVDCFSSVDDMKKVSEIFNIDVQIDSDNINSIVDDYIKLIHKYKLINRKDKINSEIRDLEKKGDLQQAAQMLKVVMDIERQLRTY